jgi:osmotically-inducible protein OsmY
MRRSGFGYEQDMPQRNDFGGHRGRNQFEEDRQFRGMNEQEWQGFSQPQHYSMDFNRNREREERGSTYSGQPWQSRQEGSRQQEGRQPEGRQFESNAPYRSESPRFRSVSDDMRSADRFRTRGGDDDGPGLYGGAEDYGHAGLEELFDYGAERHPYPSANDGVSTRSRSMSSDRAGTAWAYEQGSQWGAQRSSGTGSHRGKGPKNYSRSDDRIREDVCEYLMQDSDIDASEIEVKVATGEVTRTGSVNSKEEKRRAEDAIERISGVKDIHNELRIVSSSSSTSSRSAASSQPNGDGSTSDSSGTNGQSANRTGNSARNSARVS